MDASIPFIVNPSAVLCDRTIGQTLSGLIQKRSISAAFQALSDAGPHR